MCIFPLGCIFPLSVLSVNTFSASSLNINTAWNLVLFASPSTHFLLRTLYARPFPLPLKPLKGEQCGQSDHQCLPLQDDDGPWRKAEQGVLLHPQCCLSTFLLAVKLLLTTSARAILNLYFKRQLHAGGGGSCL